jgi:hypothetical protein
MVAATLARLRTLTDCQVCLISAYEDVEELLPRSPSCDIERRRAEEGGVQKRYGECRLLYAGHIYIYICIYIAAMLPPRYWSCTVAIRQLRRMIGGRMGKVLHT